MREAVTSIHIVADVKCYHCGHISGQIHGRRHQPLRVSDFVPRPGYTGPAPSPGMKLRCERCHGPVFLEDATSGQPMRGRPSSGRTTAVQKRTAA